MISSTFQLGSVELIYKEEVYNYLRYSLYLDKDHFISLKKRNGSASEYNLPMYRVDFYAYGYYINAGYGDSQEEIIDWLIQLDISQFGIFSESQKKKAKELILKNFQNNLNYFLE